MPSRLGRSGNQPKCCRRDISGNRKITRFRNLVAEDSYSAISISCRPHQEIIKDFFRMVPRRQRFFDSGLALCKKSCQQ
jgi:hypothetical protein